MSESESPELFLTSIEKTWNSNDSLIDKKTAKIQKTESQLSNFKDNDFGFLQCRVSVPSDFDTKRNFFSNKYLEESGKLSVDERILTDELEILKVNASDIHTSQKLNESQIMNTSKPENSKKLSKFKKAWNMSVCSNSSKKNKLNDLLKEIEASDSAKKDTVAWKFLKRDYSIKKELQKFKKMMLEVQDWLSTDCGMNKTRPMRSTCPNCTFYVTTKIKNVSTMKSKMFLVIFAIIGTMVSASSTSAKNLFGESKIRLCDRVQVNIRNIASIASQIQKGSKANENLLGAAKNFAQQEAAIENSETNLKKLQLLTTHLNNQLDVIHNSSTKMELVLEQVRSMQR